MRKDVISILAAGVLALALSGCVGTSSNADACRDLAHIQGELDSLMTSPPANEDEAREVLPRLMELANQAKAVNAAGDVKAAAGSLRDVAEGWHDALDRAIDEDTLDEPVNPALAASNVNADVELRNACSQFTP